MLVNGHPPELRSPLSRSGRGDGRGEAYLAQCRSSNQRNRRIIGPWGVQRECRTRGLTTFNRPILSRVTIKSNTTLNLQHICGTKVLKFYWHGNLTEFVLTWTTLFLLAQKRIHWQLTRTRRWKFNWGRIQWTWFRLHDISGESKMAGNSQSLKINLNKRYQTVSYSVTLQNRTFNEQ